MQRWVTSDSHFSHANIIDYCHRPFKDVLDMNEQMVALWNETVGLDDEVWHLGDLYWIRGDNWFEAEQLVRRLHGRIHFVKGDHDPGLPQFKNQGWCRSCGAASGKAARFESMHYFMILDRVLLIHDYENRRTFFREFGGKPNRRITEDGYREMFDVAFCGHVHRHWLHSNVNRMDDPRPSVALNVGVDMWNYRPVAWEVAVETQKEWLEYCRNNEAGRRGGWAEDPRPVSDNLPHGIAGPMGG